jgi:hypothetical protein
MTRLFLLISLGLSLSSCDKPNEEDLRTQSGDLIHQTRSTRRQAISFGRGSSESGAIDPVEELRKSLAIAKLMPDARDKALAEVVWNAMEIHPETAREAFLQLSADSPEKLRLIRHRAMRSAAENPDEAIDWAAGLDSEIEISAATSQIALELATKDPVRAANLLSDFGIEGREFDVAVVQVVQRWAANAPPDAVAWVRKFAAGEVRQASLQAVFERWLIQDSVAAIQWAQSIDDGSLRHETESAISSVLIQQPETTRERWLEEDQTGFLHRIRTDPKSESE